MKRQIAGLMMIAALLWPLPADALRCNGRVIDIGSNKVKVLDHCGEPTWVEERQEERILYNCRRSRRYRQYYDERAESEYHGYPEDCVIHVTIEEWFYNFGSGRFTRTLIFENGKLVDIQTGEYGY
ncbi:DUF2845 domain-containing protein [Desulfonema ishimotonii]|uniref:DUF2845 domain-containing protein n=1 Tax=Desulfonema ishimotonii TaxID=45657 RepID=A0A401FY19_9BACT|nr:DUF2845 domain-containing protein [Desulfonema ishimotonii]GBC61902.1 DUF2845 domain-containing protein [Desulfonema ishimotonii]